MKIPKGAKPPMCSRCHHKHWDTGWGHRNSCPTCRQLWKTRKAYGTQKALTGSDVGAIIDPKEVYMSTKECPKCGSGRPKQVEYSRNHECLLISCLCGFSWQEPCKDANGSGKGASSGQSEAISPVKPLNG